MKLPKRLTSEPVLEAIFEIRFRARTPVASILPGVLFTKLKAERVEQLPAANLPELSRQADPIFRVLAVQKVHWDTFFILIGDESLAIGCKLPYPGWTKFGAAIGDVLTAVADTNLIEAVSRYSIKYINLLETDNSADALSKLNLEIKVGDGSQENINFQLRVELAHNKFISVVHAIASANAQLADTSISKSGTIIDIDTIFNCESEIPFGEFLAQSSDLAKEIHEANKTLFFQCLKSKTIESLGAEYE
ncbi:TIGR04255 family protein [Trinickia terrae]|uniref:TIGR04255 family protein n=1 Tax=Trinickia terrae TaxID=2571161 RepID=A0A4U1HQ19_9BURK|nr:TIGR04255 family protein [Trinickia terrae]TKC83432.1 TIGR04255 family protein [Trinickia terrae]